MFVQMYSYSKINQQRGDNSYRGGRNHGHFKYRGNGNYNRGRFDPQQTNFDTNSHGGLT